MRKILRRYRVAIEIQSEDFEMDDDGNIVGDEKDPVDSDIALSVDLDEPVNDYKKANDLVMTMVDGLKAKYPKIQFTISD